MKIWLTTDTHFFDNDMVDFLGRPKNHTYAIVKRWNALINETDLVIHLGDLTSDHVRTKNEIMPLLKGRKILVLGNHDDRSNNWYYDAGFNGVFDGYKYYNIYFTHMPAPVLPSGCTVNIHGHFHNNSRKTWEKGVKKHSYLLSLEDEGLFPVKLDSFLLRHDLLEAHMLYKKMPRPIYLGMK